MKTPLDEYPRPQLVRDSYLSLNGEWEYAIRDSKEIPDEFDGTIIVPFSPETKLSGINQILTPEKWLFYKKEVDFAGFFEKDKVILHFTAVDQIAEVFVNNTLVGNHVGGFLPFEFDIKPYLKNDKNIIIVRVQDTTNTSYHSSGKQTLSPNGIWYPAQSGIYLPVWVEGVSEDYIQNIKITPNVDDSSVTINVKSNAETVSLKFGDEHYSVKANQDYVLKVENPHLWTPEDPYLYEFEVKSNGDTAKSYFALRKISLILNEKGQKVIALNNKPYFIKAVLDQGYYQDGLLTPSCDEDYINDITMIKNLGFNCSRKHIKIESLRWYYHCDRLGLIVWQDFVNGCTKYDFWLNQVPLFVQYKINDHKYKKFFRENEEGRKEAIQEFKDTIEYLYSVPSIMIWTIFNEGWGQFDSKAIYEELKEIDKSRLFDHASGWHDQGSGDFKSRHIYQQKIKVPSKRALKDRAYVLSECGAFILDVNETKRKKANLIYTVFNNKEDYQTEYQRFIEKEIIPAKNNGMSAFVYTQFSDVEDEKNGFISYDRKTIKVDIETIKNCNDKI